MRYPCFCATQRQFFGHGSSAFLISIHFFVSRGSGMGPAHCPCKMDIQLPTPPITAYNSFILRESCLIHAMRMPYSSLNQYHPGTFGSSVHSSARGRAFHCLTAYSTSTFGAQGPHIPHAGQNPYALVYALRTTLVFLHAGHGSNVTSGMIPPVYF